MASAEYDFPRSGKVYFLPDTKFPCFMAANLLSSKTIMTLDEVKNLIKSCARQMDAVYGQTVFDEWAVISLAENRARVLAYVGPRNDDFLKNFANDLGSLREELLGEEYGVGDFAFARHGTGTRFEAFMVLGTAIYLICNHTNESMDTIAKNPKWLNAQVAFAELGDKLRMNPLTIVTDTQFFNK
jgi:hypothetical protein